MRVVATACAWMFVASLTASVLHAQHAPATAVVRAAAEAQERPPAAASAPVKDKPKQGIVVVAVPPPAEPKTPAKNEHAVAPAAHGAVPNAAPGGHAAPAPAAAKEAHEAPKPAAVPSAAATPKAASLASAVARIQERMAEISAPAPGRGRASGVASSGSTPKPSRIYLDWRAPLVWPPGLVGADDGTPRSLHRITLVWRE
jgi:hypothetical protein